VQTAVNNLQLCQLYLAHVLTTAQPVSQLSPEAGMGPFIN